MQAILFILILFLIVIFSILLYFKTKHSRLDKLHRGICPTCGAEPKEFFDHIQNKKFFITAIESKLLTKNGCSGTVDIEYKCKECGQKEVHSESGGRCSL